jgi:hypothetical protein
MTLLKTTTATALCAALALAAPATAGTFDVKGAEISKGETEIAVNSAFFNGYPINADLLRTSVEASVGYGFSDWWKAGLKINFDKPVGGDLEAVTAGAEVQFLLRKLESRGPAVALFAGVDKRIADDATNTMTVGPLWQWALDDKTSFALNTLFSRTFGTNSEPGTDFGYAWQLKREVREGFSLGLEAYGVVPNIRNSPGIDFQEHRVGPVLYFERSLARSRGPAKISMKDNGKDAGGKDDGDGGPKLNIEAGVLFGLTDGTQDRVYKLKGAVTF